jgi:phosphohistidine phosphatase
MRTLYLLRHAKSSWKDDSLRDFDRPLKERGRQAAKLIGRQLAAEKLDSPYVISSPAMRARETSEIVLKSAGLRFEPVYDERIYEADRRRLLEVLSGLEEEKKVVLLIGHNPGMEELLEFLTGERQQMTTAALAKIKLRSSTWQEIREEDGHLEWLITPKKLQSL